MYQKELRVMIEAAKVAQSIILKYYHTSYKIEVKNDESPVTIADKESNKAIERILKDRFPAYSILSEETTDDKSRLNNDYVFIVDPLDGTKEFITRNDEFTINIALVYKNEVVVGVILLPISGEIYYAIKDEGAYLLTGDAATRINVSDRIEDLIVLTSRHHRNPKEEEFITKNQHLIAETIELGASLKATAIASGKADVFYRHGLGTKEWDTAPQDILIHEAGGLFLKPDGKRYTYNRDDVVNREGYIIVNRKENYSLCKKLTS